MVHYVSRRLGKPLTDAQRRARHKARFGTSKLPPRGSGLRNNPRKGRIIEAYCWRPILCRKNPLGEKECMRVAGGCIIGVSVGKKTEYFGAGTIKMIPVSRKDIKAIARDLKK